MRQARIKADGAGYYHGMSRAIERRHIFGREEKEHFCSLMRRVAGFCGIEILTYALMDNHFHILLHIPAPRELSDADLCERLAHLYKPGVVARVRGRLERLRQKGLDTDAEALKRRYTYRMHDVSEFFKSLKQRFSQYYNKRAGRCGPLWEQRFKSVLVEDSFLALRTMALYIDLNPVRAGLVSDPRSYRYSGYGEALSGGAEARNGLCRLLEITEGRRGSWEQIQRRYGEALETREQTIAPESVRQILADGGRLPMPELLRCRVRYFSESLALGSQPFLDGVLRHRRGRFGSRRRSGAMAMRGGEWGELMVLHDLRGEAVSPA